MAKAMNDKVNGPAAAALLAGGIGAAILGIVTILAEASEGTEAPV